MGEAPCAGQFHLCLASGHVRGLPPDARDARPASAIVRLPIRGQRDDGGAHLRLRHSRSRLRPGRGGVSHGMPRRCRLLQQAGRTGLGAAGPVPGKPLGIGVLRRLADFLRGADRPRRAGDRRIAARPQAFPVRECVRAAPAQLVPSAGREQGCGDSRETHAAALEYVDRHIGRLFAAAGSRRRCFAIVCSDHGTAYGDDGFTGHRLGHEAVWTIPYAQFFLEAHA